MAEIWPSEGLDLVLAIFPKNGTNAGTTYLGLWGTTFTASTVGTAANARASYTEVSNTGSYARAAIGSAAWQANTDGTAGGNEPGRKTVATQQTLQTATASWGTINGFFLANTSTLASGNAYYVCNFDDTTAIPVTANDIVKVTPGIELRN